MAIVSCGDRSLPRSLDVDVQVSKAQVETLTDLSVMVALTLDAEFDHDAGRVRYYSTLSGVQADPDIPDGSEAEAMAIDFFSQSPRAQTLAIARIFDAAVSGFLLGNTLGTDLAGFQAVTDGEFAISIDGVANDITGMNFSAATSLDDVAVIIEAALQAIGTGGFTAATAVIENNQLRITSGTTGASSTVSFLSPVSGGVGTDISGSGFLNADAASGGKTVDGYTPGDLVSEATLVREAGRCAGRPIYGWTVEKSYRDTQDQIDLSDWAEALDLAILGLQSNNALASDAGTTTDIGFVINAAGNRRTFIVWDDKVDEYPEVAILSYMLHVNYFAEQSTVTAKFKDLNGITPAGVTESELSVLQNKRYNVFTRVGNNSRTFRDGVESNDTWFMDDLINLDNFKEQLQVDVYNVFLREKKVPYTPDGVGLLYEAMNETCARFVFNGTFADRPVLDQTRKSGERIDPAYTINITPLSQISAAQRATRDGPPAQIDANLAGAIHSISINVTAFG